MFSAKHARSNKITWPGVKDRKSGIVFLVRLFDLAAASKPRILHRSVPTPPVSIIGVGRGGKPDLWVKISIKLVFSKD
jgi:hypothetical protein